MMTDEELADLKRRIKETWEEIDLLEKERAKIEKELGLWPYAPIKENKSK